MARVTEEEVKAILDTTLTLTAFITTANLLVTEELEGSGYSEARLKQIELYLSAHFACLKDPRLSKQKIGDAEDTYQVSKLGMGLEGSSYGQQVLALDSNSILANLSKPKAGLETLSTVVPAWGITGNRGY